MALMPSNELSGLDVASAAQRLSGRWSRASRREDAIQPGFQLLQLGGFNALAVDLCGFGAEFLR